MRIQTAVQAEKHAKRLIGKMRTCAGKLKKACAKKAKKAKKTRVKKGMLHVVEATIAFIILVGFIIFIIPQFADRPEERQDERIRLYSALAALEKGGELADLAVARNLSGIKSGLSEIILTPLEFTVGISSLNATDGESSENITIEYSANASELDSAEIEVSFSGGQNPRIYENSALLWSKDGDASETTATVDLVPNAQTGRNTVSINATGAVNFRYALRIIDSSELEPLPENKSIVTAAFIIPGNATFFRPTEVRVYGWR